MKLRFVKPSLLIERIAFTLFGKERVTRWRRLKLAAFLEGPVAAAEERTGRQKLNMAHWRSGDKSIPLGLSESQCGTSACAIGWATVLWPRRWTFKIIDGQYYPSLDGDGSIFYAASEFFGIPYEQSKRLFGPDPATPKEKARQLRTAV